MVPAKKNAAYVTSIALVDQANTKLLKANPTIAAGDFKISKDGGAFANLTNLPTVEPAGGVQVKLDLTSTEMNADRIMITAIDAAGAEWCDQALTIHTSVRNLDDLAFPATSGRSLLVATDGGVTMTARLKKNTAFANFLIDMVLTADDSPATGKTVTVTRSIDGGAFGAGSLGSVTEVGNGTYKFDFAAADLNGNSVMLRATAADCYDVKILLLLEP
jgi:hypothetical protein